MRHGPHRREHGLSLIEVMISSGVMMAGVIGLLPLLYNSTAGVVVASKLTQATALAQSRLDSLVRQPFASPLLDAGTRPDGTTNLTADGSAVTASAFGDHDGNFYRTIEVETRDFNAGYVGDDYKLVTVIVAWWDKVAQRERSVAVIGGRALLE